MTDSGGTSGTPIGGGTPLTGTSYKLGRFNQLPLESWRNVIGYNPWHFWGQENSIAAVTSKCNEVVPQYSWQKADVISRNTVKRSIVAAEDKIREYLGYSMGRNFVEETIPYPRPTGYGQQFGASIGGDSRWLPIKVSEGKLRSVGVETYAAVEAGTAVVLTDADGDGLNDTFTITLAGVAGSIGEIGVYFAAANRLDGEPVSERWRINPVFMSLSGGTLTIKGRAYLLVDPIKYEGMGRGRGLDPDTAGVLVGTVDVYRRYSDPDGLTTSTAQAVLIWETAPYPSWANACGDGAPTFTNSADPAALAYAVARAQIRDAENGYISVGRATYDSDTDQWYAIDWGTCRQPDRVTIRYEAGAVMAAQETANALVGPAGAWDLAVARMACAELPRRDFGCAAANQELYRWQFDRALESGAAGERYSISEEERNNPFGTSAGHIYAWRQVRNLLVSPAVLLG